jgi:uncharacterized protein
MKRLSILASFAIATSVLASSADAASFNCSARLTKVEKAICSNPGLSTLDSRMSAAYFNELAVQPKAAYPAIKGEQSAFLRARNGCGANVGCLTAVYRNRIKGLTGIGY